MTLSTAMEQRLVYTALRRDMKKSNHHSGGREVGLRYAAMTSVTIPVRYCAPGGATKINWRG